MPRSNGLSEESGARILANNFVTIWSLFRTKSRTVFANAESLGAELTGSPERSVLLLLASSVAYHCVFTNSSKQHTATAAISCVTRAFFHPRLRKKTGQRRTQNEKKNTQPKQNKKVDPLMSSGLCAATTACKRGRLQELVETFPNYHLRVISSTPVGVCDVPAGGSSGVTVQLLHTIVEWMMGVVHDFGLLRETFQTAAFMFFDIVDAKLNRRADREQRTRQEVSSGTGSSPVTGSIGSAVGSSSANYGPDFSKSSLRLYATMCLSVANKSVETDDVTSKSFCDLSDGLISMEELVEYELDWIARKKARFPETPYHMLSMRLVACGASLEQLYDNPLFSRACMLQTALLFSFDAGMTNLNIADQSFAVCAHYGLCEPSNFDPLPAVQVSKLTWRLWKKVCDFPLPTLPADFQKRHKNVDLFYLEKFTFAFAAEYQEVHDYATIIRE